MGFALTEKRPLTTKQELFIAAYLGEAKGNATEAARRAGYKHPDSAATDNMANPRIRERITDHVEAKFASADEVLSELTDVGMSEWRDHITLKRDPKTGDIVDVRMDLHSKVKSLELLGKYHQLFIEKKEISGPGGGPIPITTLEVVIDEETSS